MRRTNLVAALAAALLPAAAATLPSSAAAQIYIGGSLGGQQYFNDEGRTIFDVGGFGSLAVGYRLPGEVFRVEFEAALQSAKSHGGGSTTVASWTPNLFIDIPTGTSFAPYVGGGVGGASADGGEGFTRPVYVWQAEAGLNYNLSDDVAIGAGYRYQQLVHPVDNLNVSVIKLNLIYRF